MKLHLTGPTEKTAIDGIDRGKGDPDRLIRLEGCLIQALLQDGLDRFVAGIIKVQRPRAGVFQTQKAVLLAQTDYPLGGAQIVQDPVTEEHLDQLVAVGTDPRPGANTIEDPGACKQSPPVACGHRRWNGRRISSGGDERPPASGHDKS